MLPKVRTSDGFMIDWNKDKIIDQLIKESSLAKKFFDVSPMTKKEAGMVALLVENRIIAMNPPFVSSPMVRELVNNTLLELSASEPDFLIYRNVMTRVGTPVYDAYQIDVADGFEKNENANLQNNPETIHKKKADLMSKEQYLLLMPPELANAHHGGDIHIHTLEYFGSRPFCQDYDLRYFLYYGFIADGLGYKSSVAGPAKHASVAVLQSVKALAAGQTNFAGGQGLMYYTVFLAPYLRGLDDAQMEQIAQMVYFELTQTYIARGGQPVFSSIQLPMGVPKIWKDVKVVMKGRVGPDTYGSYEDEVQRFYRAIQNVSIKGDYWGKPFNFPKQENYVSPEFFKSEYDDLWLLAHKNVAMNGSPYFDNMIPEYRGYGNGISCYQCCLTEDILIPIKRNNKISLIETKDLMITDEVMLPSGIFSGFDSILKREIDEDVLNIVFEGGRRYRCTVDHELPVIRNNMEIKIKACDLDIDDKVILDCTLPETYKELDVIRHNGVNNYDEIKLKLAWLLGLFSAEGSLYSNNINTSRGVVWSFGATELDLIEKTKQYIKDVFNVEPHTRSTNHETGTDVIISRQSIHDWFVSNGITAYKTEACVPSYIFSSPKEVKWQYINGYYSGDGCFRKNGVKARLRRIEMNTISKKLSEGMILLLGSLGYNFKYGIFEDKRENRHTRYMFTLNKEEDTDAFFKDICRNPIFTVGVREIQYQHYSGFVYDPVNVDGHKFVTGQGIVTGNCAYQFSNTPENDEHFAEKLNFIDGAHFSMGGWQVASINMPRLAYKANGDYDKLLEYAQENMRKCIDVFKVKKMWMDAAVKNGTLPFATQRPRDINGKQGPPLVDFSELVYVIGVVGINEMVQHFTGKQLHESTDAVRLAVRLLIDMEKYRKGLQMKTGMKLSLARTPAESTAQTFAVQDLMSEFKPMARSTIKGDLTYLDKVNGRDIPLYYTNGTHINVSANISLAQKMDIEQKFFPILSGGNIFQVWMGENNSDPEGLYRLTKKIVNNSQIGYFAYTKDLTICSDCNTTSGGLLDSCPVCNSKNVKNWSRITGYYSDVSGWNASKKQELRDRVKMKL